MRSFQAGHRLSRGATTHVPGRSLASSPHQQAEKDETNTARPPSDEANKRSCRLPRMRTCHGAHARGCLNAPTFAHLTRPCGVRTSPSWVEEIARRHTSPIPRKTREHTSGVFGMSRIARVARSKMCANLYLQPARKQRRHHLHPRLAQRWRLNHQPHDWLLRAVHHHCHWLDHPPWHPSHLVQLPLLHRQRRRCPRSKSCTASVRK